MPLILLKPDEDWDEKKTEKPVTWEYQYKILNKVWETIVQYEK